MWRCHGTVGWTEASRSVQVWSQAFVGRGLRGGGIQRDFLAWHLHPRGVTADPAFATAVTKTIVPSKLNVLNLLVSSFIIFLITCCRCIHVD